MIKKRIKYKYQDYLLVSLLIAYSGFPYFTAGHYDIIYGLIIALIIFISRRSHIDKVLVFTLLGLTILVIGQTIILKYVDMGTTLGLFINWLFPFFVIKTVGEGFSSKYVNVMYFFAIVSFLFFFPSKLIPGFQNSLLNNIAPIFYRTKESSFYECQPNIIIYTFNTFAGTKFADYFRNSGPFWEPGAFSGYIIVALVFNLIKTKRFYNDKNIVFIIAIISSFSTTGFIALSFLIVCYLIVIKRSLFGYFVVPAIIIIILFVLNNVTLFSYKINETIESTNSTAGYYTGKTRAMSAMLDIVDIKNNILFGKGRNQKTRYGTSNESIYTHRNNGDTDFIVRYGILFSLVYFYSFYRIFRNYALDNSRSKFYGYIGLLTILLVGFSETYFQYPVFIALFYLSFENVKLIYKPYKIFNNNRLPRYSAYNSYTANLQQGKFS